MVDSRSVSGGQEGRVTATQSGGISSQAMQGPPSIKNADYKALLEQLAVLRLPPLKGKRFLNINCHDGFFCGYAAFSGAVEVVGIDKRKSAIELAKTNFPKCEFHHGSGETLAEGLFDVILLSSDSYHTCGVGVLIHHFMKKLAIDGTLVIEIALIESKEEFVKVKTGGSEFTFLSWKRVNTILNRYAWKSIGHRDFLPEARIEQYVIHIRNMKPYAFLLLESPASGKSTLQRVAFKKPDVQLVSGDQVLLDIFNDKLDTSSELKGLVKQHFISTSIAKLTKIIFANGLGPDLIRTWCKQAGHLHFVLDSYLHKKFHKQLQSQLKSMGYVPVTVNWSMDTDIPLPKHAFAAMESYRDHLREALSIVDPEKLPMPDYRSRNASDTDPNDSLFSRVKKAIARRH